MLLSLMLAIVAVAIAVVPVTVILVRSDRASRSGRASADTPAQDRAEAGDWPMAA